MKYEVVYKDNSPNLGNNRVNMLGFGSKYILMATPIHAGRTKEEALSNLEKTLNKLAAKYDSQYTVYVYPEGKNYCAVLGIESSAEEIKKEEKSFREILFNVAKKTYPIRRKRLSERRRAEKERGRMIFDSNYV